MATIDLANMSDDGLMEAMQGLQEKAAVIKAQKRLVSAEIQRRASVEEDVRLMSQMTPDKRARLKRLLKESEA